MRLRRPALHLSRRSPSARADLSSDKDEVRSATPPPTRAAPARIPAGCVNITSCPLFTNLSVGFLSRLEKCGCQFGAPATGVLSSSQTI